MQQPLMGCRTVWCCKGRESAGQYAREFLGRKAMKVRRTTPGGCWMTPATKELGELREVSLTSGRTQPTARPTVAGLSHTSSNHQQRLIAKPLVPAAA